MNTVIFYHKDCMDGTLAVGFIYEQLMAQGLVAEVVGLKYPALPDVTKYQNTNIIILDYFVPAETQVALLNQDNRLFYLDHHAGSLDSFDRVFKAIAPFRIKDYFVIYKTKISSLGLAFLFADSVARIIAGKLKTPAAKYVTNDCYVLNFSRVTVETAMEEFLDALSIGTPQLAHVLSNTDAYSHVYRINEDRPVRRGLEALEAQEPERSFMTYSYLYRRYAKNWDHLTELGLQIEAEELPILEAAYADATTLKGVIDGGRGTQQIQMAVLYIEHAKVNVMASYAFSQNQQLSFIVALRPDSTDPSTLLVSFRGNNLINYDIDLSQVARSQNGGGDGHFNAAGARIEDVTDEEIRSAEYWEHNLTDAGYTFTDVEIVSTPEPTKAL